ncbi:hypothetical protein HAX54_013751, partial [Datura stramonium]|nr:hypothetical protein [Datura stramonium]
IAAEATWLFYGVVRRGERDGRGLVVVDLSDVRVKGGDGITGDGNRGRRGKGAVVRRSRLENRTGRRNGGSSDSRWPEQTHDCIMVSL